MSANLYQMDLVLGDWSDDGHGKSEKITLVSNKPVLDVQEAYKAACKLTGIQFNHNEDYTGKKRTYDRAAEYRVCTEYEESELSAKCRAVFAAHGISTELYEKEPSPDNFTDLWTAFVKLADPQLELRRLEEEKCIPVINGMWNANLNVQFGYGLYR